MFSVLGDPERHSGALSRRELMRVGGSGVLGLGLPTLLQASAGPPPGVIKDPTFGKAKNLIFVWLQGGPPQHETFDPKPEAPSEIRGPFQPIQTNIPGIDFCELLPRTARMANKLAVIRSLATDNNVHSASGYEVLTGYKYRGANARMIAPTDWPFFGSIIKLLKPSETLPPLSTVWIPRKMHLNENVTPAGQTAGFLGSQWDPNRFEVDPSDALSRVEGLDLLNVPQERFLKRKALFEQIDNSGGAQAQATYDTFWRQAFDILSTGKTRQAFDIESEPARLRDRYGRNKWAQCLLLARRLIEAGSRMVHVNWCREPGDSAVDNPMWDTHALNADRCEDVLCPIFDVGFSAFLEDLDQRGLLSETLVVAVGEFGRTPKINDRGGRDHWGAVFSCVLAGAGVQTAQVYGSSDKIGGHPARDRVSAGDLTATIFHLMGVSHKSTFHDPQRREHRITEGTPVRALLGGGQATADRQDAGGSLARVPPWNNDLLLNTDFAVSDALRPAAHGSRPKGWRADPLLADPPLTKSAGLGVRVASLPDHGRRARLGVLDGGTTVAAKATAVLGQEMRSPRLGNFSFTIQARGVATSKHDFEKLFLRAFRCRLVIFRYKSMSKNPLERQEFISLPFTPRFSADAAALQSFQVSKRLDSGKPGQNFPIGKGFGVAVIVEHTGTDELVVPAGHWAALEIDRVDLTFTNRDINDKVTV